MTTRRYSTYDSAQLGTALALDNGGVVLTTDTSGLNINRTSRGSISRSSGTHYVEFIVYGDAASLANKVSIGVCTSASSLATYVGGESTSIGYRLGEGQIHRSGGSVASVSSSIIGDVVGVLVSFGLTATTISWYRNGSLLHTYSIDIGSPLDAIASDALYWAVSLGSTTAAGDIKVFVSSGRQQFEYPPASSSGWYSIPSIGNAIRVSDVHYLSGPNDDPPSMRWHGLIKNADMVIDRAVSFWPWSDDSGVRGSVLTLTVSDPDGLLDDALSGAFRDQPVTIQDVDAGAELSTATTLGEFVVERVEVVDELTRRIVCRDQLAALEAPLQRRFIRPDAAPDAAFRPCPTTIGACFSVEPVLIDETYFRYMIDSIGLSNVGKVRDAGDPLETTGSPTAYYLETGGQVLNLSTVPYGILTLDAEYTGAEYEYSDGSPPFDAALGDGYPFAGSVSSPGSAPTDWTASGTEAPYLTSSAQVEFPQDYNGQGYLQHTSGQLVAGTTYQFEITVHAIQRYTTTNIPATIGFSTALGTLSNWFQVQSTGTSGEAFSTTSGTVTLPYTFKGTYTPSATHDIILAYLGNNIVQNGNQTNCRVSGVRFVEVPTLDNSLSDDTVEEALEPLPLNQILREIIETRGGKSASIWNQASATAIDTATGYQGQGFHAREQVTIRQAIDSLLDGYTCSPYLDRSGVIQFMRLIDPTNETADATLDQNDMLSPPLPQWDEARGLSRQMGVRRNERVLTDTDLVTDEADVTLRLRRKLGRRHRYVVATGAALAGGYEHADAADPVDTRLVKRDDGQSEINRVGAMYTTSKAFYTCRSAGRDDLEIGDVVTVTYPRFGLDNGVNLLLVGIRENRINNTQELTFWGNAP